MPKFDSKEEYLKWKEEKLQQGKEEPTPEKGQLPVDNNASNSRRSSVKAFYIFPAILLILAILYFIAKPFDYSRGHALVQNTNHKEDNIDATSSKPEQEASALTTAGNKEPEITKPEPAASTAKPTFSEIVKQAKKAVVTIKTSKGHGSGFFISSDGKIVTNTHVVGKDETVEVVLSSGFSKQARVIMKGTIPLDIAILEINSSRSDYDYLELGDSSDCAEGTDVIAIGSPEDPRFSSTVTKGIVSSCNRGRLRASGLYYLQTDTPINPGNSGGPLIDSNGKVIGVNTLKIKDIGIEGLGFAIGINVVKDFMSNKLTSLEEKFRSEREEDIRKLVNYFKGVWEQELSKYRQKVLNWLYPRYAYEVGRTMSWTDFEEKAEQYVEPKKRPLNPSYYSIEKWFEAMAEDVIDQKITVEQVINIVKIHFSG